MAPKTHPQVHKGAALDKALRGAFKKLERRPVPDHIMSVVDQLEAAAEAAEAPLKKSSGG